MRKSSSDDAGGIQNKSKWVFYENLLFLKDIITTRNTCNNIPSLKIEVEECDLQANKNYEDVISEDLNETNESALSFCTSDLEYFERPSKKIKCDNNEKSEVYEANSYITRDADFHFLISLLPELKKVPAYRKLHTKIRIQQLLLDEQQHISEWNEQA